MYTRAVRCPSRGWFVIGGALLMWATASLPAQNVKTVGGTPIEDRETTIRLVAVVTDARGEPVGGLTPADFELQVDGQPQAVDTVESRRPSLSPARTFVFLLDEFHTPAAESAAVRDSLLRFVDRFLRPVDLAVVIKPLDSLTSIVPTTDREALRSAITTFEGRKGDYAPRTTFERDYMAQAPAAVATARAQIVTSALRAIGMSLPAAQDARPAIVLVSDGFARIRSTREVPANLQTAIRVANRVGAPVYALAPTIPAPADPSQPADPAVTALAALATQTGGELVAGAGTFESGLARMMRDLDSYYVLAYRAAHGNDGRFHAVQVGVKRRGAVVRAQAGYVAPMSAQMRAALDPQPAPPMRVLRRSTLIQSWSGIVPVSAGRVMVTFTWEPAAPRPGGPPRAPAASIVVTASTPDGAVLFDAPVAPVGSAPAAGADHATFEAPAGVVRVDIKILDAKGVVVDTDARDVAAPTSRAGSPTIYAPAVLRAQSAREFRELSANPNAAPVPTRAFRRTERLIVRVPAMSASGDPVPVTAILLNRLRQPMRELPAMESPGARHVTQFDLPLATLVPGDYALRFAVPGPGGEVSEYVTFRVGG
jgi:VWFA-related protein